MRIRDGLPSSDPVPVPPLMWAGHGLQGSIPQAINTRQGLNSEDINRNMTRNPLLGMLRVPDFIYDRFRGLHALAFESNYDRRMQIDSHRPAFLKRRIMGGSGHLSNEQSFEAVTRIAMESKLSHVVLLHLSRECNDPRIITKHYAEHAPDLLDRLTITNQFEPTPILGVHRKGRKGRPVKPRIGQQLSMFDA